jgi:acetyl esterase/lipase
MRLVTAALLVLSTAICQAQERVRDVIYLKKGGCAFTLDVFKSATPNHKAVVYMVSGGWFSDHNNINEMLAKAFTDRGFTLFEVVHGSQPKYTIPEIVPQVRRAVRFVRANAATYGIDPEGIGVCGSSAGGHLSLEIAGLGDDGNPTAQDPVDRASSRANAVVAFFPPTDFLNWGAPGVSPIHMKGMEVFMPAFGVTAQTPEDKVIQVGHDVSPVILVKEGFPPTLLIHGDADKLVPLQQSQELDALFEKDHVVHKLVVVKGSGHDAVTFMKGLPDALAWFDANLKG